MFAITDSEINPIVKCIELENISVVNYKTSRKRNCCIPVVPTERGYYAVYEHAVKTPAKTGIRYCLVSNEENHIVEIINEGFNRDFYEQALAINKYLSSQPITQTELGLRMGYAQSTISNKMRVLNINKDVLEFCLMNGLSERHLRELIRVTPREQQAVATLIVNKRLNVDRTRDLINTYLCMPTKSHSKGSNVSQRRRNLT
jgi:hypothetical protein